MKSLNKTMIIGHLAAKPELFNADANKRPMATARVAVNETWKDPNTQVKQTRTTWFDIVMFGKRAVAFHQWTDKGKCVYVEGRLEDREYDSRPTIHQCTDAQGNVIVDPNTQQPYQVYVVVKRSAKKLVATSWDFMDEKAPENSAYTQPNGAPASPSQPPNAGPFVAPGNAGHVQPSAGYVDPATVAASFNPGGNRTTAQPNNGGAAGPFVVAGV
jgi:single stranded DNA-binding protein